MSEVHAGGQDNVNWILSDLFLAFTHTGGKKADSLNQISST